MCMSLVGEIIFLAKRKLPSRYSGRIDAFINEYGTVAKTLSSYLKRIIFLWFMRRVEILNSFFPPQIMISDGVGHIFGHLCLCMWFLVDSSCSPLLHITVLSVIQFFLH